MGKNIIKSDRYKITNKINILYVIDFIGYFIGVKGSPWQLFPEMLRLCRGIKPPCLAIAEVTSPLSPFSV